MFIIIFKRMEHWSLGVKKNSFRIYSHNFESLIEDMSQMII
jgi:hypothetical protein